MIEIKNVPLDTVWQMRQHVMYPAFSIDQVKLPDDETGVHLGIYVNGEVVSVVSVFITNGALQFRKFATSTACQGKGYGSLLLQQVMQLAAERHCTSVWCNARTTAAGFYHRFGMQEKGDTWTQNGHVFVRMEK